MGQFEANKLVLISESTDGKTSSNLLVVPSSKMKEVLNE